MNCGGGVCAPCVDGRDCKTHTDCASGVCYCTGGVCEMPDEPYKCLPATCQDGTTNGGEMGIDCGGPCEMACP
jgi:hypothetical protein